MEKKEKGRAPSFVSIYVTWALHGSGKVLQFIPIVLEFDDKNILFIYNPFRNDFLKCFCSLQSSTDVACHILIK